MAIRIRLLHFLAIIAIVVASCSPASEPAAKAAAFDFNKQIGWLHGPCFAIASEFAAGTPLTLVIAGEPQKVEEAKVQAKTDSNCPALLEDRAALNKKSGATFYALEGALTPSDMGFGIVMPPATPAVLNGNAQVDLDGDGKPEVFTSCATSEGVRFAVWSEKAYQGEPRWSAYYYLGYDLTPTCPN